MQTNLKDDQLDEYLNQQGQKYKSACLIRKINSATQGTLLLTNRDKIYITLSEWQKCLENFKHVRKDDSVRIYAWNSVSLKCVYKLKLSSVQFHEMCKIQRTDNVCLNNGSLPPLNSAGELITVKIEKKEEEDLDNQQMTIAPLSLKNDSNVLDMTDDCNALDLDTVPMTITPEQKGVCIEHPKPNPNPTPNPKPIPIPNPKPDIVKSKLPTPFQCTKWIQERLNLFSILGTSSDLAKMPTTELEIQADKVSFKMIQKCLVADKSENGVKLLRSWRRCECTLLFARLYNSTVFLQKQVQSDWMEKMKCKTCTAEKVPESIKIKWKNIFLASNQQQSQVQMLDYATWMCMPWNKELYGNPIGVLKIGEVDPPLLHPTKKEEELLHLIWFPSLQMSACMIAQFYSEAGMSLGSEIASSQHPCSSALLKLWHRLCISAFKKKWAKKHIPLWLLDIKEVLIVDEKNNDSNDDKVKIKSDEHKVETVWQGWSKEPPPHRITLRREDAMKYLNKTTSSLDKFLKQRACFNKETQPYTATAFAGNPGPGCFNLKDFEEEKLEFFALSFLNAAGSNTLQV